MKIVHATVALSLLLAGCGASTKAFYADRTKPNDTSLCRIALDDKALPRFRSDVTTELIRRGMTVEACRTKVNVQNAVVVAAAIVGVGVGAAILCNNGCASLGGGAPTYTAQAVDQDCEGGMGDGPIHVKGPFYLSGPDIFDLDRDNDGIACEASDALSGA